MLLKNFPFASNFALKCVRLLLLYEARVRKHSKYCKGLFTQAIFAAILGQFSSSDGCEGVDEL
jgi:hypothetical protein